MINGYWILNGHEPVETDDVHLWGKFFESRERIVEQTEIGEAKVSTVFLGLDHSFAEGPPLFFETMIFGGEHDQYQERYSTWDEAIEGHKKAVALCQ